MHCLGIAAGIGVVCGFITLLIRYVGLFLIGFFLGSLLAFAGKAFLVLIHVYNFIVGYKLFNHVFSSSFMCS